MPKPITFKAGSEIILENIDPRQINDNVKKKDTDETLKKNAEKMAAIARRLYAENKRSILLVLQGMDTAGKDSTIRNTMRGVNPRSCQVVSFKKPSEEELDHDFLWRIHKSVPRKGNIGIFNRSHYEDVLVVRVHNLVPEEIWSRRYEQINEFEKILTENGTTIIKCYLHISKEEQRERLQQRLDIPEKRWKFNIGDLAERKLWNEYQKAYDAALEKCNTSHAPWYIIPSDRRWVRNLTVSQLLLSKMEQLDPQFPDPKSEYGDLVVE